MGRGTGRPVNTCRPPHGQGGRRIVLLIVAVVDQIFMGRGRLVKTRGPRHRLGGAAYVDANVFRAAARPISFLDNGRGPTGPINIQMTGHGPARPGPTVLVTDAGPRPGPANRIFNFSRPGRPPPAHQFLKILGPARHELSHFSCISRHY